MKSLLRATVFVYTFLIYSSLTFADSIPKVDEWVEKTLSETFIVLFNPQQQDNPDLRNNYTNNAWRAINGFFSDYISAARSKQLIIHPVFKTESTVIGTGSSSGIRFWRVNQQIFLPELQVQIAISVVVLLRSLRSEDPYVIQSMDFSINNINSSIAK